MVLKLKRQLQSLYQKGKNTRFETLVGYFWYQHGKCNSSRSVAKRRFSTNLCKLASSLLGGQD